VPAAEREAAAEVMGMVARGVVVVMHRVVQTMEDVHGGSLVRCVDRVILRYI
jgi:hypothetical protein